MPPMAVKLPAAALPVSVNVELSRVTKILSAPPKPLTLAVPVQLSKV